MLKEEGYRLVGAAFEVYNQLGYGMAEEIYQQSLEMELDLCDIPYSTKPLIHTFYKGRQLTAGYYPDLVVCDRLVVELKAVKELASEHEAQLFNYLRISRSPVGYLINFGKKGGLQWRRYIVSDLHELDDG